MRKKFLSLVLVFSMILGISSLVASEGFTDVSNHWAKEAIEYLAKEGILEGDPSGRFRPNDEVTRAEFSAMINRTLGLTEKGEVKFTDVPAGRWYYNDVAKAVKNGYTKGYPGNKFMPLNPISRQEASVMIGRALGLEEINEDHVEFTDTNRISDWAKGLINAVKEKGYINGYPSGEFQPQGNISRAEAANILFNVLTMAEDEDMPADIASYNSALEAVRQEDYTKESWQVYQGIVGDNLVTIENTQEEVDAATFAIIEAQADLVTIEEIELEEERLAEVTYAIEVAEASLYQEDLDIAMPLVEALQEGKTKSNLLDRLEELQVEIDNEELKIIDVF